MWCLNSQVYLIKGSYKNLEWCIGWHYNEQDVAHKLNKVKDQYTAPVKFEIDVVDIGTVEYTVVAMNQDDTEWSEFCYKYCNETIKCGVPPVRIIYKLKDQK